MTKKKKEPKIFGVYLGENNDGTCNVAIRNPPLITIKVKANLKYGKIKKGNLVVMLKTRIRTAQNKDLD